MTRLPRPRSVSRGTFRWVYFLPIATIHLLALLVLVPWLFSWTGVLLYFFGINVVGQLGVPVCYHRQLTHRSFRTPKWLERCFVGIALCNGQETPAKWVAWHRIHHQHTDVQEDPHSPLVNFFWSHVGWLFYENEEASNAGAYHKYARDILEDPFYMFLEKHRTVASWIYLAHAVVFFLVGLAVGWATTGEAWAGVQFGLSVLVWGVFLRTVHVWHITWAVNSLSHMFGYRNYETDEESRNNWFVAFITGGEGWHNNHHHDPTSASVQHRWWEIDLNYYIIKTLEFVGLATDVVEPRLIKRTRKSSG